MPEPIRFEDYRRNPGEPLADLFKWVVGGTLTITGALAGVLWFMLMGQVNDLKGQISQVSNSVADLKGDVKLLSARSADQLNQISEMQGYLKKR